ncbi:hypothetical protein C8R44DRAFT_639174, partial [Mycena epipterygia]
KEQSDIEEQQHDHQHHHGELTHLDNSASARIVGIVILEFGVILHSVLIGLTLAVEKGFKIILFVILFHRLLGLWLTFIKLDLRYNSVPIVAAIVYGLSMPVAVGIAIGLAVRSTYNPGSATASIVSGVLDSLSAGILMSSQHAASQGRAQGQQGHVHGSQGQACGSHGQGQGQRGQQGQGRQGTARPSATCTSLPPPFPSSLAPYWLS